MIDSRLLYSAWPIRALAIATACIAALPAVRAETDLIESTWVSESPKCTIREIKFYDFAHALVKADGIGTDEADWKEDLGLLHVTFQHWDGKLEGPIDDEGTFKAIYTWRSEETLEPSSVNCPFHRK